MFSGAVVVQGAGLAIGPNQVSCALFVVGGVNATFEVALVEAQTLQPGAHGTYMVLIAMMGAAGDGQLLFAQLESSPGVRREPGGGLNYLHRRPREKP
jgi:hypothetical protein